MTLDPSHQKELRDWLKTQPHLPQITDSQLLLFLHSCYYNMEESKTTIENYFTFKTQNQLWFNYPNTDEFPLLIQAMDTAFSGILPTRTPQGYIIILIKLLDKHVENYNYLTQCKQYFMGIMLHLHKNELANGIVLIFDGKDYSFSHMLKSGVATIKKALFAIQEALPVRVKGLHITNVTPVIGKLLLITKPFLRKELYEMIQFHKDYESLYKAIPRVCLIEEYGGCLPLYVELHKEYKKQMVENQDFFEWHSSQTVDESKRPTRPGYFGGFWKKIGF